MLPVIKSFVLGFVSDVFLFTRARIPSSVLEKH